MARKHWACPALLKRRIRRSRARPLTVRVFRAVVQSFVSPVPHARQHLPQRRPIAGEFVHDHHP